MIDKFLEGELVSKERLLATQGNLSSEVFLLDNKMLYPVREGMLGPVFEVFEEMFSASVMR